MRKAKVARLLLVGLILCVCGCTSNNEGKLDGTYWSSQKTTYQGITVPPGAIRLEFKKSGDVVYQTMAGTFKGKYSYGWGDQVVFNMEKDLAGRKRHVEKVVVDDQTLTMTDSDGTSVSFRLAGSW